MARGIARGDIRLLSFKPPDKRRPVVVLTRDSSIELLDTVLVAPITSKVRGVPTEVMLDESDGMKIMCAVNLHNMTAVSQERLGPRMAKLGSARMQEICAALNFAAGCTGIE